LTSIRRSSEHRRQAIDDVELRPLPTSKHRYRTTKRFFFSRTSRRIRVSKSTVPSGLTALPVRETTDLLRGSKLRSVVDRGVELVTQYYPSKIDLKL
jgi:hypothetical protein